jgi:hypothetical protein
MEELAAGARAIDLNLAPGALAGQRLAGPDGTLGIDSPQESLQVAA